MKTHVVEQGECLSSIARKYGFTDLRPIYNHPQNAGFKKKRPDPNVIFPGDQVVIPDTTDWQVACATEHRHRFRLTRAKTFLRIVLVDENGQPIGRKKYILTVERIVSTGHIDDKGLLERVIPADAETGELVVFFEEGLTRKVVRWPLQIGHLDPVEEISGAQARLNNLGYECGEVDGVAGPFTQAAICVFQERHRLHVDGVAGLSTQQKLKEEHGC